MLHGLNFTPLTAITHIIHFVNPVETTAFKPQSDQFPRESFLASTKTLNGSSLSGRGP